MRPTDGVLLVYLEPTPYILGLLRELRPLCRDSMQVWFLMENASQDWHLDLPDYCQVIDGGMARLVRDTWRLIRTGKIRLIHLGGWGGDTRLSALILMAWASGISLFIESDTQKPFEESPWRRWIKRLAYPLLFRVPVRFLPGGSRQAAYLKSYGVTDERIQIAQMTVDVAAIEAFAKRFGDAQRRAWRDSMGILPETTVVLFVGRFEPQKGITALLSAFDRLVREGQSAQLVLVGDGSMRGVVDDQAAVKDWMVALGRLAGEKLLSAYCAADVFVLPSRFEPWGLVVNEAMAAGLPVVASNRVGCVDDLIDGRDTGVVYNFADAEGLFDALHKLLCDVDGVRRMSSNARQLISSWTLRAEAERVVTAWGGVT